MLWRDYLSVAIQDQWNYWFRCGSETLRIWKFLVLIGTKTWQMAWGLLVALFGGFIVKSSYGEAGLKLFMAAFFLRSALLFTVGGIPAQLSRVQKDPMLYQLLAYPLPPRLTVVVRAFSAEQLGYMADVVLRQRLLYLFVFAVVFKFTLGMAVRSFVILLMILALGLAIRVMLIDYLAQRPQGKSIGQLIDMGSMFLLIFAQGVLYLSVFTQKSSAGFFGDLHRQIPQALSWSDPFTWPSLIIWHFTDPMNYLALALIAMSWGFFVLALFRIINHNLRKTLSAIPALTTWKRLQARTDHASAMTRLLWIDRPWTRRFLHMPRFLGLSFLWAYFISQELAVQLLWVLIYPALIVLILVAQWLIHQPWLNSSVVISLTLLRGYGSSMGPALADLLALGWVLVGQRFLRSYVSLEALGEHFYYFRSFPLAMSELLLIRATALALLLIPAQVPYALISGGWVSHGLTGYVMWIISNILFAATYALWYLVGSAWMPVFSWKFWGFNAGPSPSSSVMTSVTIGGGMALALVLLGAGWPLYQTMLVLITVGTGLAFLAGRHLEHYAL